MMVVPGEVYLANNFLISFGICLSPTSEQHLVIDFYFGQVIFAHETRDRLPNQFYLDLP